VAVLFCTRIECIKNLLGGVELARATRFAHGSVRETENAPEIATDLSRAGRAPVEPQGARQLCIFPAIAGDDDLLGRRRQLYWIVAHATSTSGLFCRTAGRSAVRTLHESHPV